MPKPRASATAPPARQPISRRVFEGLPYGVVVVDGRRRIIAANPTAVRLLWDVEDGGPPAHCHDLFACRANGGPCEHGCLVERATAAGESLPEIRIDSAGGGGVTALWVTAAPLDEHSVLLHLRPGDSRDRRRRSDPHWLSGPALRISAFGRTWVDSPEGPLGGRWLGQRPGQLLKYLVCERNRVVHADEIAEALWPDAGRQGLNNVRHFMHALRAKLEPDRPKGAPSSFVITVQGGYALDRRRVRIDADEFEQSTRDGLTAAERQQEEIALERLEHAAGLYREDLLADEPYAEWAYPERDRLRALADEGLRTMIRILLGRRDLPHASVHLERLADLEPYDAEVHRTLLAVWLAEGRRGEAARRYAAFKARLGRDLGELPAFELADVRLQEDRRRPV